VILYSRVWYEEKEKEEEEERAVSVIAENSENRKQLL
jgi:hypothetical protein